MARLTRLVVPGTSHLVAQRSNARQQVFFGDVDYAANRDLLATPREAYGTAVWSWVLMPNHVHLILVPGHVDSLRGALGQTVASISDSVSQQPRP